MQTISIATLFAGMLAIGGQPAETKLTPINADISISKQYNPKLSTVYNTLLIGGINRGFQFERPADPKKHGNPKADYYRLATSYYHRLGPLGVVLERYNWFPGPSNTYHADARMPVALTALGAAPLSFNALPADQLVSLWSEPPVGLVTMYAGTPASYARPFQHMYFYESNPEIIKLATLPTSQWQFVDDAKQRGAQIKIFQGSERKMLQQKGPEKFYKVLVVELCPRTRLEDISVDLLTKEGMKILMDCVADDGLLCYHVSNRYINAVPLIVDVSRSLGYAPLIGHDSAPDELPGHYTSQWMIVARKAEHLKHLKEPVGYTTALKFSFHSKGYDMSATKPYWRPANGTGKHIWTDDSRHSIKGLLHGDPAVGRLESNLNLGVALIGSVVSWQAITSSPYPPYMSDRKLHDNAIEYREQTDQTIEDLQKKDSLDLSLIVLRYTGPKPKRYQPKVIHKDGSIRVQLQEMPHAPNQFKQYRTLMRANINRGTNFIKPDDKQSYGDPKSDFSRLATCYHHRESPIGIVMKKYNWFHDRRNNNTFWADYRGTASLAGLNAAPLGFDVLPSGNLTALWSEPPVAVVNMYTGTMASYANPMQTMHFFESDERIIRLSLPKKGEPHFHYVKDAKNRGADIQVFHGKERPTIAAKAPDGFYQVMVVEICPRDRLEDVSVELMTKEGMRLLMSKVREDGILCYHVSNRYLEMRYVIADVADSLGYRSLLGQDSKYLDEKNEMHFTSEWIMVARRKEHLAHLRAPEGYASQVRQYWAEQGMPNYPVEPYWSTPAATGKHVWTDKSRHAINGLMRSDPAPHRLAECINLGLEIAEHVAWKAGVPVGERPWVLPYNAFGDFSAVREAFDPTIEDLQKGYTR